MRALLLDGSIVADSNLASISRILAAELDERGFGVEQIVLRTVRIAACQGDFACWVRTPGLCITPDHGRVVAEKVIAADTVALLTPVTFGGYSSELKKAMDRLVPLVSPFLR